MSAKFPRWGGGGAGPSFSSKSNSCTLNYLSFNLLAVYVAYTIVKTSSLQFSHGRCQVIPFSNIVQPWQSFTYPIVSYSA